VGGVEHHRGRGCDILRSGMCKIAQRVAGEADMGPLLQRHGPEGFVEPLWTGRSSRGRTISTRAVVAGQRELGDVPEEGLADAAAAVGGWT